MAVKTSSLFEPISIGGSINLRNRICMGSMTRNRCTDNHKPTDANVKHYADRAKDGAGLIIAEGTFIYLNGSDFQHAPMMYKDEHAEAWRQVTDAVHREGGKIFFQAWHPGRAQHEDMPLLKDNGYPVLAPSKIRGTGGKYRQLPGMPEHTDNVTEIQDFKELIDQYRNSAALAKKAGFDGIEILAQGGYLLQTFLYSVSNQRTDDYGGSVQNRCRFVLEVVDAIVEIWGPGSVGIKICPADNIAGCVGPYKEIMEIYNYLVPQLVERELGYVNVSRRGVDTEWQQDEYFKLDPRPVGMELPPDFDPVHEFGPKIKFAGSKTLLMVNHDYTVEEAAPLLDQGKIDIVAFGRPFIYNPDLITRIKRDIPFATNDRGPNVNYGPFGDPNENYNDWPIALTQGP